jgi:LCP family protein required for cell wall assembly
VLAATLTFYLGLKIWDTNTGILVFGMIAGIVGGVVWYLITRIRSGPSLADTLAGIPLLGTIPSDDTGPAPALNDSDVADRYTGLLREIEGQTTGRVLLVSSPGPGQGASSVALNLSIAAAKAGRRVMLVDADPSSNGIGRFLSSGSSPGLSDVAAGKATLAEASRMWTLDDGTRFPMLPSGDDLSDSGDLDGILVADALDVVSERADLIVIDVPPVLWSSATPELGAHADGTILVISDTVSPEVVSDAIHQLDAAGSPVLGYVRNRSKGTAPLKPHWVRGAVLRGVVFAFLLLLGYSLYTGTQLVYSWATVETEAYDSAAVDDLKAEGPAEAAAPEETVELELEDAASLPASPVPSAPTEAYESMLLIGSDQIAGAADVILYLVRPTNGSSPFMVSLPRDLYVENPCTGGNTRINTLIKGCASENINGPTLLSYQVGAITGIEVDHFASFDFEGFVDIIEAVGGVEICVENPVRDRKAKLDLPAGCTQATGEQALAWVRSRKTQQLVNGSWRSVPGASDLTRNQHQQEVILQLFTKLKSFSSPTQLTTKAASLSDAFVLDSELGLSDAVDLAWGLRAIDLEDINRLELPVRLTRSKSGQSILIATIGFDELLLEVYGVNLPSEDGAAEETASARR